MSHIALRRRASVSLLLILVSACTPAPVDDATDGGPPALSGYTWHQDIHPVMHRACLGCHSENASSGIDLSTPELASVWAMPIASAVAARRMPPFTAAPGCTDYLDDFSLTSDEQAMLVDWALKGTPLGDPDQAAPLPAPYTPPTLARTDVELSVSASYTPTHSPDDYRCFLIDWPYDVDMWITGIHIKPQNREIAHHAIPYLIPAEDVDAFVALDDEAPGPGYPCFGGPGGSVASLQRMRWLGAWAPGGGATLLPEGVGLKVSPGAKVALQMHYHVDSEQLSAQVPPADQTQVAFQLSAEAQGWATTQPWTDIAWVLGAGMEIPAQSTGVTHEFRYTIQNNQGFAIRSASLHMHELGREARFSVVHPDGTESCLLHEDHWDFNWQRAYALRHPVIVEPGDEVVLRCTWDNPTDHDVKWGDGTLDEMCLGITLLSEAPAP